MCIKEIEVKESIPAPVYVSYELTNFYQNHRRYVKSLSYTQLMGEPISTAEAADMCDPVSTNAEMNKTYSFDGTLLDPQAVAYPCGLIAKSLFTDAYNITTQDDPFVLSPIPMSANNIAWKSDVEYKYKNQAGDWQAKQWIDVENCKCALPLDVLCRALHRLDEDCGSAPLPQTVRGDRAGPAGREVLRAH